MLDNPLIILFSKHGIASQSGNFWALVR